MEYHFSIKQIDSGGTEYVSEFDKYSCAPIRSTVKYPNGEILIYERSTLLCSRKTVPQTEKTSANLV